MTPWKQQSLWEEPAAGTVIKDGAGRKVTNEDGKTTTKRGRSYTWLRCSECGGGTWVAGLAPDQDRLDDPDYFKEHGRPCRSTPKCSGRHVVARES